MKIFWIKPKNILIIVIILMILLIGLRYAGSYIERTMYPIKHSEYIEEYAYEYNLDPWLVVSVIWVESKFDEKATSSKDARGLMQITPETGKWISKNMKLDSFDSEQLYDPETNIKLGCWYLDSLKTQFNNELSVAIAAYNGGSGNVTKWLNDERYSHDKLKLKKIPFEETENYVERVFNTRERYKEIYKDDENINWE